MIRWSLENFSEEAMLELGLGGRVETGGVKRYSERDEGCGAELRAGMSMVWIGDNPQEGWLLGCGGM